MNISWITQSSKESRKEVDKYRQHVYVVKKLRFCVFLRLVEWPYTLALQQGYWLYVITVIKMTMALLSFNNATSLYNIQCT